MKKQFLSISFFLLTAVAGMNVANAQNAVKWSDPRALENCDDDALHPRAGKQYMYIAETDDSSVDSSDPSKKGQWRFWATTDPNFITDNNGLPQFNTGTALEEGTNELLTASSSYNIDVTATGANNEGSVEISWTSGLLNSVINQRTGYQNLFVVAYYVNNAGCTDNVSVWELFPTNSFTVDLIAMDIANPANSVNDYSSAPSTCVDVVESLTYQNGGLVYDYGDNYLYFEFIAANFTDYWIPEFSLDGLHADQDVEYEYTYALPDTWNNSTTWTTLVSGTTQILPEGTYTNEGVSVFVRVKVDHNNYENLNGQTLTLSLDGKVSDGNGGFVYDTVNATCIDPNGADQNDTASATITARPNKKDTQMPTPNFIGGDESN